MDFIDYREKLGIGFNDEQKIKIFYNRIFNVLDGLVKSGSVTISFNEYFNFCNDTGTNMDTSLCADYLGSERFKDCINIIREHMHLFADFISYYVWFVNSLVDSDELWSRRAYKNLLVNSLNQSHIDYELLQENENYFIFPKGAKELDDALVSEPLEWLKDYHQAHKTYCIALKQYADGIYVRDVADNLRKALEEFLREFLGNDNDFNKNKKEVEAYLKSQNADAHLITILVALLNHYYLLNNEVAKHNDKMDKKYLEFLLYQTGIFIRTLIIVKREENKQ